MNISDMRGFIASMARNAFFRNIFVLSLIIAVIFPLYGIYFVMPSFTDKLITNIEEEAYRTGTHLSSMFFNGNTAEFSMAPESMTKAVESVKTDFNLENIKVFSNTGEIIYSTAPEDIGTINRKDYFHNTVAKGRVFSTIVKNNSETMEGRTVNRDVVEVYIPVMHGNRFITAFEIYYDITERKQIMDNMLFRSSVVAVTASAMLFCFVLIMLIKAGREDMKRKKAENSLKYANDTLEDRVEEQTQEIQLIQATSIEALAVLAEYYDHDTGGHLERIQNYVGLLTTYLKDHSSYSGYIQARPDYIRDITLASVLHDIGKTSIPKGILTKPGKLTGQEFDLIKKHTEIAGRVLDQANKNFLLHFKKDSYLAIARDIALYHHEKWNGEGYPHCLKGDAIPLSARIVAIADVYDALRSRRPYKPAWPHKDAVCEIIRGCGLQFDPVLIKAFIAVSDQFEPVTSWKNVSSVLDSVIDYNCINSFRNVMHEGLGSIK